MWCKFDKTNLPIVRISFFDDFLNKWLQLYEAKENFYFIFDTRDLALLNIKYAYKMSNFIKELKKRDKQYLKKSIIIVKNKYIQFLLNIVFSITRPVADAYLFSNHNDKLISDEIENIKTEKQFLDVIEDFQSSFSIIKSK